jgi:GNAT superfamily N-acetyltransferase
MNSYTICSHAEKQNRAVLLSQLTDLENLAFGHYYGNIIASSDWVQWYTSRPGMVPSLCQAAFAGDELVASVLVTLWPMRLAGETVLCGLIDQVMTHPEHRRHGLARTLMQRAVEGMTEAGAEVSLLNTFEMTPMSGPQRLYESLGYRVLEKVDRYARRQEESEGKRAAMMLHNGPDTCGMFEEALGNRDGWLLLDVELWHWRREQRPLEYPVLLVEGSQGQLAAVVTGNFLVEHNASPFAVITEMNLPEGSSAAEAVAEILSTVPTTSMVSMLCARSELTLAQGLEGNGFRVEGTELAMVKALSDRGARLVASRGGPWYVAVESIIGI